MNFLLALLALGGFIVSIAFGLKVTSCQGICFDLSELPAGRLIDGVPNWLLGISYYTFLLLAGVFGGLPSALLMSLTLIGLLVAIYLFWVLVFRLHTTCGLCFASHAINLLLFLVVLL